MEAGAGGGMKAAHAPVRRVILLHGIWMVGATMRWLAKRLRQEGFAPEIFGYHSIVGGPQAALPHLVRALQAGEPAHLVGHSLGGLLAVQALSDAAAVPYIGRVLCLGTPLCGSAAARVLARSRLAGLYLGRSASILQSGCAAWPPTHEVGMIAGRLPRGLGALLARFEGEHDGTVSVAETHAPGLAAHVVVDASHSGLLWSRAAMAQAVRFLREGRFDAVAATRGGAAAAPPL
jgi:pimeloyl-ACP methyl ester carboxylesterase